MASELLEKVVKLLKEKEFVYVATADLNHEPYAASKFFLKANSSSIYLVDFVMSQIYSNLKTNPKASIAVMDEHSLHGYRLNGNVSIIESGHEFKGMVEELSQRKMNFTTERVIRAVQTGVKNEHFELSFPDRFVIFKIDVHTIAEINPQGGVRKEKVK